MFCFFFLLTVSLNRSSKYGSLSMHLAISRIVFFCSIIFRFFLFALLWPFPFFSIDVYVVRSPAAAKSNICSIRFVQFHSNNEIFIYMSPVNTFNLLYRRFKANSMMDPSCWRWFLSHSYSHLRFFTLQLCTMYSCGLWPPAKTGPHTFNGI